MGIKDLIKMNDEQPTPITDAATHSDWCGALAVEVETSQMLERDLYKAREQLERERDEARERAESKHGLWMSELSRVTALEKQLKAMREAITEAQEALDNCVEFINDAQIIEAQWHWEPVKQSNAALAKLQPFIKP